MATVPMPHHLILILVLAVAAGIVGGAVAVWFMFARPALAMLGLLAAVASLVGPPGNPPHT